MAGNKYISLNGSGDFQEVASTQTSSGAGDAGKIVALNSSGLIDSSMISDIDSSITINPTPLDGTNYTTLVFVGGSPTNGDDNQLTFTGTFGGSPTTADYTTGPTDTLTDVAVGLTAAINANGSLSGAGITATSHGTRITIAIAQSLATVVTNTSSGSPTETLSISDNALHFYGAANYQNIDVTSGNLEAELPRSADVEAQLLWLDVKDFSFTGNKVIIKTSVNTSDVIAQGPGSGQSSFDVKAAAGPIGIIADGSAIWYQLQSAIFSEANASPNSVAVSDQTGDMHLISTADGQGVANINSAISAQYLIAGYIPDQGAGNTNITLTAASPSIVSIDNNSGSIDVYLPAAGTCIGKTFILAREDGNSSGTVTVHPGASGNFLYNGSLASTIVIQSGQSLGISANDSSENWVVWLKPEVRLTKDVSGILPTANGGTGANNTATDGHILIGRTGANDYTDGQLTSSDSTITVTEGTGTLDIVVDQANLTLSDIGGQILSTQEPWAITATANENIAAGALIHFRTDGKVENADNTDLTKPAQGFAPVAVLSGNSGSFVLGAGADTSVTSLSVGVKYFLGTVGGVTSTPPSTTGNNCQYVGIAKSSTILEFIIAPAVGRA